MMGTLAACGLPVLPCPVLPFAGMIGAKVLGTLALAISSHFPLRREAPGVGQGETGARAKDEKRAYRKLHQHAFGSRHIPQAN